jgi:superfamily II DNA helicase RecQ
MPPTKKARTVRSNGSQHKKRSGTNRNRVRPNHKDRDNLDILPHHRTNEKSDFTEYNYPFSDGPIWAFRNDTSQPFLNSSSPPRELEGEYDRPKAYVEYTQEPIMPEPEFEIPIPLSSRIDLATDEIAAIDDTITQTIRVESIEYRTALKKIRALTKLFKRSDNPDPMRRCMEEDAIREAVMILTGFNPRPGQISALRSLVIRGQDCILKAKTSYGKSVVFLTAPLLCPGSVAIILMPLNIICKQQVAKCDKLGITRSIHICAETLNSNHWRQMMEDIRDGRYTHIFTSPEMAVSQAFSPVMNDPPFKSRLICVAVDECHLITKWGNSFRPEYRQLNTFRQMVPNHVAFFGCSATIDKNDLKAIIKSAGFRNPLVISTPLDRPDITYTIVPMPSNSKTSFLGLSALLPDVPEQGWDDMDRPFQCTTGKFKKTLCFLPTRIAATKAVTIFNSWLVGTCGFTDQEARKAVAFYTAHISDYEKGRIEKEYLKPDSQIIWLFATTAFSLGADIPDIASVIVYGIPDDHDDLSIVLQQLGRGSRGPGKESEGIWMIEDWAEEQYQIPETAVPGQMRQGLRTVQNASDMDQSDLDSGNGSGNETEASSKSHTKTKRGRVTNMEKAKKRSKLPAILQQLFRTPPPDCLDNKEYCYRRIILKNYDDRYGEIPLSLDRRCCSNCHPILRLEFEAKYRTDLKPSEERWKKTGRIFQKALDDPLNQLVVKTYSKTRGMARVGLRGVMSEKIHKRLCNAGFSVTSLDDLKTLLRDWLLIGKLGVQLWDIMQDIQSRQKEIERKWSEEVDAPKRDTRRAKNMSKETSQKNAAVRKPRGPSMRLSNTATPISSRQHPIMDPRVSTPAIVGSHVPTLLPPNQHPTAQHHDITQSMTPAAYQGYIQPHYNYTPQRQQIPWIHPLYYGEQGNIIQPHSNCCLGSPAQAGQTYINNGRNPLQEFDPNLQTSMQGFVRHHPDQ